MQFIMCKKKKKTYKKLCSAHTPSMQSSISITLHMLLIQKADMVTDSPASRIYHSNILELAQKMQ